VKDFLWFGFYCICISVKMALTVDVVIAGRVVLDAIIGSAAAVNIMPSHTMETLGLQPTGPSTHSLIFPGGSESIPAGVIKDIPVDVGRVRILTTFHVLPMLKQENSYSLLLGIPWMRAARPIIKGDKDGTVVEISGDNETVTIPQRKMASGEKRQGFISVVEIGRLLTNE